MATLKVNFENTSNVKKITERIETECAGSIENAKKIIRLETELKN